jgi:hypothetical protein
MRLAPTRWLIGALLPVLLLVGAATVFAAPPGHALLIGISRYDPASGASPLEGVPYDMQTATQIARRLGVAPENIRILRDSNATKAAIVSELGSLTARVSEGGRAMIYFSGHGTRWFDPGAQGCVEGLYTYEGGVIVNREFAALTKSLSDKADKLVVMFDACHSGGVSDTGRTRSIASGFSPKFTTRTGSSAQSCAIASNLKTRSLVGESSLLGVRAENIVHISSSRPDEVSFDEPGKGGLATQAIRDCMFGEAKDLDGSGAITLAEIESCARQHIRSRLAQHPDLLPHHPIVSGQRNFIAATAGPTAAPTGSQHDARPSAVIALPREDDASRRRETLQREQAQLAEAARLERERERAMEAQRQSERQAQARREQDRLASERREAERLARQRAQEEAEAREEAERKRLAEDRRRLEEEARRLAQIAAESRERIAAEEKLAQQALADEAAASTAPPPALAPSTPPPTGLGPIATLQDIFNQRDPRLAVDMRLRQPRLKIDRDELSLTISSSREGFLYLIHIESDLQNFSLLFPNALHADNKIRPRQTISLPRLDWRLVSAGPPGTSRVLAVVSESPRDISILPAINKASPFSQIVSDLPGRGRLLGFVLGDGGRFGAALAEVEEFQ